MALRVLSAPAVVHASWTDDGVAFWAREDGKALSGPQLRLAASRVLGTWWPNDASSSPLGIPVPGEATISATALVARPREAIEVLAERYPMGDWSASLRWFHAAATLALQAAGSNRAIPAINTAALRWRTQWELIEEPELDEAIQRLDDIAPPVVFASAPPSHSARDVVAALADAACRWTLALDGWRPPLDRSRTAPVVALRRITTGLTTDPIVVGANERHEAAFASWSEGLAEARSAAEGAVPTTSQGRLLPPDAPNEPWTVAFEVVSVDDPSLAVTWAEVWDDTDAARQLVDGGSLVPVRRRIKELANRLAVRVPSMEPLGREDEPRFAELDIDEVGRLLVGGLDVCERSGVPILIPSTLIRRRAKLTAAATPAESGGVKGNLGQTLVEVDWGLALGDEALTEEELTTLAAAKAGLVQMRGEWVQVDAAQVEAALTNLTKRRKNASVLTPGDVLRTAAESIADVDNPNALNTEVSADGWLAQLFAGLPDDALTEMDEPEGFVGTLRPYQRRAVGWAAFLGRLGLGGCLADDMGLGKTPTTLAHLAGRPGDRPHLVICPLSVVHNWQKEAAKFTPHLKTLVAHGADRRRGEALRDAAEHYDILITTYGTATRDIDELAEIEWDVVVCDEAQAIKNHHTKAARAVRKIDCRQLLALTGTPVENRLSELWSILDAVNPGMLGGIGWFKETFASPIEQLSDENALAGLHRMTGPFVLRRTKADKSLVPDLPDKVESVAWATLTKEQASLYQAVVDDFLADADAEEGMKRRGLVLSTLTRLKQICNHPAHFTADNGRLSKRSGKLERFDELVDELLDADERALIFTQYREMGELLKRHLAERHDVKAPFLHGGVAKKRRDTMVENFQSGDGPPLQIISLKAGGTGLNLTAASRVIHYDRWWNPAVEDQATDRAWRIGQKQTVFVHKLVCRGTLEERIDTLINDKKALAESVVGAGEGWLTEMSTDDLRAILTLDPTTVSELR